MREVVYLKQGEAPPEAESWVLVTQLPSGRYEISAAVQVGPDGASHGYTQGIPKLLGEVVEMARRYAEHMSDAKIYVHWNCDADRI